MPTRIIYTLTLCMSGRDGSGGCGCGGGGRGECGAVVQTDRYRFG